MPSSKQKVLVVDDDRSVLHMLKAGLADLATQVDVLTADRAETGLTLIREHRPDAVLLDVMMPGMSGLEAVDRIHEIDSRLPVIFITAGDDSEVAIEAMKRGAFDYLLKPLDLPQLQDLVEQALESRRFMSVPVTVIDDAKSRPTAPENSDVLVGCSEQMLRVYKAVGRIAAQDVTVLIRGESGTGKELIARAIYQHSKRSKGPFLAVNCAALTDTLLESELFGHEKGAFTGADQRHIGKFERCDGGTIFLDEVGDMSPLVQSKVLRVLQEQEFERVGGTETIKANVRIIAATNRDLERMVEEEEFRSDLFYRLNGFTIHLPPLRERGDDIRLLLEHFFPRFARQFGKDLQSIAPGVYDVLYRYPWPGNVRQFQSVLKQAILQSTGPTLIPEFLPAEIRNYDASAAHSEDADGLPPSDLKKLVDACLRSNSTDTYADALLMMERYVITRCLRHAGGNQSKTARILGITRGSLRNKIRTLGISIDSVVNVSDDDDNDNENESDGEES